MSAGIGCGEFEGFGGDYGRGAAAGDGEGECRGFNRSCILG